MPELPEIDTLMRSLRPLLVGAVISRVELRRPDVVRNIGRKRGASRLKRAALLAGCTIAGLRRHGKELAVVAATGEVLLVHLGMSGQLWHSPPRARLERSDHVHCIWSLAPTGSRGTCGRLIFRDPRRFGGLWVFDDAEALYRVRWRRLGPDALTIDAASLQQRLAATRRPIKAALLDQHLLAGIGNIYADEILFAARIHPMDPASSLRRPALRRLASAARRILRRAAKARGSTIRDYRDGRGQPGGYAVHHAVYGRAGLPCRRCGQALELLRIAQRATVCCSTCQGPGAPA